MPTIKVPDGLGGWVTLPTIKGDSDTLPIGSVVEWFTDSIPLNWLLCHGQLVSRSTYSDLFAVLGTTYGVGDGSTTFGLPNLKGRVPVGKDAAQAEFDALGETGGEKTHTDTLNEMPVHNHKPHSWGVVISNIGNTGQWAGASGTLFDTFQADDDQTRSTENAGGGSAHNNLQPYIVSNFIIKAKLTPPIEATVIDNLTSDSTADALSAKQGKLLQDGKAPIDSPTFTGTPKVGISSIWHGGNFNPDAKMNWAYYGNATHMDTFKTNGQFGIYGRAESPQGSIGILDVHFYSPDWITQVWHPIGGSGENWPSWQRQWYGGTTWTTWRQEPNIRLVAPSKIFEFPSVTPGAYVYFAVDEYSCGMVNILWYGGVNASVLYQYHSWSTQKYLTKIGATMGDTNASGTAPSINPDNSFAIKNSHPTLTLTIAARVTSIW